MKITPSRLVHPTPASGWAVPIRTPKDVNLDASRNMTLKNDPVGIDQELDLDEGQLLVVAFVEEPGSCQYSKLLVLASPDTFSPVVIGDSRVPGLYHDALDYRQRLAKWRPGIKAIEKAEHDVEFSFALRATLELSSPKPKPQPPTPEDESFLP
jgi:hypothetical protein